MSEALSGGVEQTVCWLISDTFNTPRHLVTLQTQPEEIDGWDSLGHAVLLTRLTRRLGVQMDERLASPIVSVGELVERFVELGGGHVSH